MAMSDTARTEQHDFSAEVGRLLDLVVNALYSDREIFLRELVANAADAIDRRRFLALTEPALSLPEGAAVRVTPDKGGRQLAIADDGIGMSKADLAANLGTIARSGTRAFGAQVADAAPDQRPSLIGQFGVGFYSAFMVAERVEVVSRLAGSEEAWRWASDGHGSFTLTPAERETPGTEVVLHIKPDAEEFLDPIRLETIIRKWADHIAVPLLLVQDGKALPA
ncbi:MAG TPA: ATP-binding protein, partial [Acetobacteraceae bacterium]|nr:ATP-binding protein [Acetobacteraceae bacterium]